MGRRARSHAIGPSFEIHAPLDTEPKNVQIVDMEHPGPAIELPPWEELGPKMRALHERERAFVVGLVRNGGNQTKAGFDAGCQTRDAAEKYGWRAAHREDVREAMKEWAQSLLGRGALVGAQALLEIAEDPLHKDRLKAAVELMNRNGMIVQTQHKVVVEDNRSTAAIVQRVLAMAERLALDPRMLLEKAGIDPNVIDADFEPVALPAPKASDEGLEDLL